MHETFCVQAIYILLPPIFIQLHKIGSIFVFHFIGTWVVCYFLGNEFSNCSHETAETQQTVVYFRAKPRCVERN